jgi:hypothetical protein
MTDHWTENLHCPLCRKTGVASLTEGEDDKTLTVNGVPAGFKVVYTQYGPSFRCEDCGVEVDP